MSGIPVNQARKRGRPREFSVEAVAGRAAEVFARKGLSGTSMDEVAAATGLYRTSLVAAFKDKRGVYLAALAAYRAAGRQSMIAVFTQPTLRETLTRFFETALALYLPEESDVSGCFLISTALTEAATDPEIRSILADTLAEIDTALTDRLVKARSMHELDGSADPEVLAQIISSALTGIAVRARAGIARASLELLAERTIDLVCGPKREQRP